MLNRNEFNAQQLEVLDIAKSEGINIELFADPKYNANQMRELWIFSSVGLDITPLLNYKYSAGQMYLIGRGIEKGINYELYADPNIDKKTMLKIMRKLEKQMKGK